MSDEVMPALIDEIDNYYFGMDLDNPEAFEGLKYLLGKMMAQCDVMASELRK